MNSQPTPTERNAKVAAIDALAGAALVKLQQDPTAEFELAVGYSVAFDVYHAKLKSILIGWIDRSHEDPFAPEIRKPLRWGEWELTLRVDPGRRPTYGRFGLMDAGRPRRLRIHGLAAFGHIDHAVEWDAVEEIMIDLLLSRTVTFDQSWFLFGTGWAPAGLARPKVTASTLESDADDARSRAPS